MTDSQQLVIALPASSHQPEQLPFETISQTILKLTPEQPTSAEDLRPAISAQAVEAMQRLLDMIVRLRSPESGWPEDLAPTPENLVPYVTEEAYEVLDALQNSGAESSSSVESIESPDAAIVPVQPQYLLVNDLIPQLLWYIARSSYTIMQLIGGVPAKVFQPGHDWDTGILRLVAILEIEAANTHWSLDLATNQPPQSPLSQDAIIQFEDHSLGQQPHWISNLRQELRERIQSATPEINAFIDHLQVDLLEPGKGWQPATVQLKVDFAFLIDQDSSEPVITAPVAEPKTSESTTSEELPPAALAASSSERSWLRVEVKVAGVTETEIVTDMLPIEVAVTEANSPTPVMETAIAGLETVEPPTPATDDDFESELQPLPYMAITIRFSDPAIVQTSTQTLIEQRLTQLLPELQAADTHAAPDTTEEEQLTPSITGDWVPTVVKVACEVVEALQNPQDIDPGSVLRQERSVEDLLIQLLWQITRSTYPIMQLVGGIKVNILQPGDTWRAGTLRLLPIFHLHTADIDWHIDLVTGQCLNPERSPLSLGAIVQSNDHVLCQQPKRVESLLTQVMQQIQTATLDVRTLLEGTQANCLTSEQTEQKGAAQLRIELAFIPDVPL